MIKFCDESIVIFFKNFFFISRVYAFEQYYKNKFKEHLSKIIDGPELEYVFMYFGAIIHMKIEKDSVQDGMMITKVSELFLYFDEEENDMEWKVPRYIKEGLLWIQEF